MRVGWPQRNGPGQSRPGEVGGFRYTPPDAAGQKAAGAAFGGKAFDQRVPRLEQAYHRAETDLFRGPG